MHTIKSCFTPIAATMLLNATAAAIDHNNLEVGRPLRFDDAYSIAYRERAIEFGFGVTAFRHRSARYEPMAEFTYGFARNRDVGISFSPTVGGGIDSDSNRFDPQNVEVSYFQSLQEEIGNAPGLAFRVDVGLPTGRDTEGIDVRLRGIATKTVRQYDKAHLNVDGTFLSDARPGERDEYFGAVLGYSAPVGFPKRFDQTMVAEFALQQSPMSGLGATGSLGIGMRRQVNVRSVVDVGISADIFGPEATRAPFRFVAGYSIGY